MTVFHRRTSATLFNLVAVALVAGLLGACATPKPVQPPAPVISARQAALQSLGFKPTTRGWEKSLSTDGGGEVGGRVTFGFDSDKLTDEGVKDIAATAAVLLSVGVSELSIEGHTDNRGAAAYNKALSERRAAAAAQVFVTAGFKESNIHRIGYGDARPIDDNATEAGRAQNRRVTIIVSAV
ncbi:OmpA family protein [Oxalobacteraceae bacterium OTU3REALA1]|nr:OmpA family protein [Oxalobacteraceae bacterium OTU3REALA1]